MKPTRTLLMVMGSITIISVLAIALSMSLGLVIVGKISVSARVISMIILVKDLWEVCEKVKVLIVKLLKQDN